MTLSRWHGLKRLVFDAIDETTSLVERTHIGVAERTLRRLDLVPEVGEAARAVESLHRVGAKAVYATIRGVSRGVDLATEVPFETLRDEGRFEGEVEHGASLDSDAAGSAVWVADAAQAVLTGFVGDRLEQRGSGLATAMTVRVDGKAIEIDRASIAAAFTGATPKIAIFVHGLSCTEWSFSLGARERWGDPKMTFGVALSRDLGLTPVYVRYNSGKHISDNGAELSRLIDELVEAWPCEVSEIVLIGHSMGGLVSRSAATQAHDAGRRWVSALSRVITLGSPHLGAPLEKGVNMLTYMLRAIDAAGAQVPAELLELRSAGIKDLRHGYTLEEEWRGRDPDALFDDNRQDARFVPGVRYYSIASTVTDDPSHPVGELLGDVMVRVPSAAGQHEDPVRSIEFHKVLVQGGIAHMALGNHPKIYEVVRTICAGEPLEGEIVDGEVAEACAEEAPPAAQAEGAAKAEGVAKGEDAAQATGAAQADSAEGASAVSAAG